MDIILIIISSFLGILGVLIEPVKKGKGSVLKRLTPGGKITVVLLFTVFIISIIKQIKDNHEAIEVGDENEYQKLKTSPLGPKYQFTMYFKKPVLKDLSNDDRSKELDFITKKYSLQLNGRIDSATTDYMPNLYRRNYMDSASRFSFIKPLSKASKGNRTFLIDFKAGNLHGVISMLQDGLFLSNFSITSKNDDDFGIDTKDVMLDYSPEKIVFFGKFDSTINGGALYESIVSEIKKQVCKSTIIFQFTKQLNNDDINNLKSQINNIEKIQFLIESDLDALRYFSLTLKP